MSNTKEQLEQIIKDNDIILFMKGDPHQPRCGFSATVVDILKEHKAQFSYFDILEDNEVRLVLLINKCMEIHLCQDQNQRYC